MACPCGSEPSVPETIAWLLVPPATCPQINGFGASVLSGFSRPTRFKSPSFKREGFENTRERSSNESSRMPTPEYRRDDRRPLSQNDRPLGGATSPTTDPSTVERPLAVI